MAAKPETRYIARVNASLPEWVHYEKTHNRFRRGMPDSYYEGNKECLWVEYKYSAQRPQRLNVANLLTELQRRWLRRAAGNNRPVAVILGSPVGGVILPQLTWEKPLQNPPLYSPNEVAQWIIKMTMRSSATSA